MPTDVWGFTVGRATTAPQTIGDLGRDRRASKADSRKLTEPGRPCRTGIAVSGRTWSARRVRVAAMLVMPLHGLHLGNRL